MGWNDGVGKQLRWWLIPAVAVAAALLTSAIASAHGGSGSLIHSCVNNLSGEIKIVGASTDCRRGYHPLDWNIEGQSGPAGDTGPQGPSGISGYEMVSHTTDPQDGDLEVDFLDCPSGKKVLGGGYMVGGDVVNAHAYESRPTDTGWVVTIANNDPVRATWWLQIWAICAAVQP